MKQLVHVLPCMAITCSSIDHSKWFLTRNFELLWPKRVCSLNVPFLNLRSMYYVHYLSCSYQGWDATFFAKTSLTTTSCRRRYRTDQQVKIKNWGIRGKICRNFDFCPNLAVTSACLISWCLNFLPYIHSVLLAQCIIHWSLVCFKSLD